MATNNRIAWTESLSLPVPEGTVSGDPVLVGVLPGVALTDRAVDGNRAGGNDDGFATVALDGVWDLEVSGALAAAGTQVYITSGGSLTATSSGNAPFGESVPGFTADGSKASGAGTVSVKLAKV
jgi:predicted RecA/RadA family phage recombinase